MDATDKPREIIIHQSANRPNLLLGGDRELVLVMVMIAGGLAFSLGVMVGDRSGGGVVGRLNGGLAAHGQGRPAASSRLPPAHPLRRVLPSKERSPWTNNRNAKWLEVTAAMQITEHRSRARGLADLLLPFALIEDGILLQQDGSLLAGWSFAVPTCIQPRILKCMH